MRSMVEGSIISKNGNWFIPFNPICTPQSNIIVFPLNFKIMQDLPTSHPAPNFILIT